MTLRELAKISGISPSTISLVLNDKEGISAKTRQEVWDLVERYNYVPAKRAKHSQPKKRRILFLKYIKHGKIVEENAGFISDILDTIEMECRKRNFSLSIVVSQNCLANTLDNLDDTTYDGIILLGTELDSQSYPLLQKIPVPYVVIDNSMADFDCNCVLMNNRLIVGQAVDYLAQLGFDEISYFSSNNTIQNFQERAWGFEDACKRHNVRPGLRIPLGATLSESFETMLLYLESGGTLPKCAFVDNDTIAIGAMKAIHAKGYQIPRDISIVGFDDIPFAVASYPPLTTMAISKQQLGRMAVKQICYTMDDPTMDNAKIYISGTLVLRESTRPQF